MFDGIGMGLGFTFGLTCIGIVRELLGSGKVFDIQVLPESYEPITIFILAPGAFFVLACLTALQNVMKKKALEKGDVRKAEKIELRHELCGVRQKRNLRESEIGGDRR